MYFSLHTLTLRRENFLIKAHLAVLRRFNWNFALFLQLLNSCEGTEALNMESEWLEKDNDDGDKEEKEVSLVLQSLLQAQGHASYRPCSYI